jgi:Domain of unknown function (DUF4365)
LIWFFVNQPEQHEIDRAGKRLLRGVLEGLRWVVNDVQEDYGIDSNVQVFEKDSATGIWFAVQLKSSASSEYSAAGNFISQLLLMDRARHYAFEMRDPVLLVHADVEANALFWYAPQLDEHLAGILRDAKTEYITVRIPTSNRLPQTAPELLQILDLIQLSLAAREFETAATRNFADSLTALPRQEELFDKFQLSVDTIKLRKAATLYGEKKYNEARPRSQALVSDPDSTTEIKFWAQLQLEGIDCVTTIHSGAPQSALSETILRHAKALQVITTSGPRYLKFYALVKRKAAEVLCLAHESYTLFVARQQHLESHGNPFLALDLYTKRSVVTSKLIRKYNQCVRLAKIASTFSDRWILGRALSEIPRAVGPFLVIVRAEANSEIEAAFERSIIQICKLSVWISHETGDAMGVMLAIMSSLSAAQSRNSEVFRWANEAAHRLTNHDLQSQILDAIDRATRRWDGESVEGDYDGDVNWQLIQNISSGLGIDISDENSMIVQCLKIAARDNSPERILVHCEHLLVSLGSAGPIARFINVNYNMSTAGSKVVHCTKFDYHVEGRDQDSAYKVFRERHCRSCPDISPRATDWKYTEDERQRIEANNLGFVTRLLGGPNGYRFSEKD